MAPGDRVLVRGAGGGIGVLAVRIARARVTAVTSSPERAGRLRPSARPRPWTAPTPPPPASTTSWSTPSPAPAWPSTCRSWPPNGRYALCGGGGVGGDPGPEPFTAPVVLRALFGHREPTASFVREVVDVVGAGLGAGRHCADRTPADR
ncbi:hypothetical protein KCV87_02935 [Actinosynnema pretiosum subsp. pretiosum]|uniref:Uncharacterized protein n=1 Tax=Actinosynnema pretiosum subsp. pretiosum TaxID=103721 RepID=A0AA45L856_9PSEU|nr:hypothetical protein APASM_3431 [Actinosynnema pretiosum subsp. pretiosum]QUF05092.1 hypothetical protein KCV87_02935 [Actinosynnema pretiosum subsp. pretiosum]